MPSARQRTVMRWDSGIFDFDAVEIEAPSHEAQVSTYPIEMGADLVDHVRLMPVTLRLTVWLSNNPSSATLAPQTDTAQRYGTVRFIPPRGMDDMHASDRATIYVKQPVTRAPPSAQLPTSVAGVPLVERVPVQAIVRTWEPSGQRVSRVQNVYAELQRSMREAREFTVASDLLGEFDRMLLRSMRTDRDGRTGNALRLDLELTQVNYAELIRRDVGHRLPKKPKELRSQPPKDDGKKAPQKPDKQTEQKALESTLDMGIDYLQSL